MKDFTLNVNVDPLENSTYVVAVMSDFYDVRGTINEREPLTYKMCFASGFTTGEIIAHCAQELAVNWYIKYGADKWDNRTGVLTSVTIKADNVD